MENVTFDTDFIGKVLDKRVRQYLKVVNKLRKGMGEAEVINGRRYIKVVTVDTGSRGVHSFIDKQNGNILKAATWNSPQKNGVRGSIFSEDCGESVIDWYGTKYLR